MKKILFLTNSSGGLYNFRGELIKELKENYKIFFTCPQESEDINVNRIIDLGANYIHTPLSRHGLNPLEELRIIKKYKKIVKEINPDIILTYTIKPNIYGSYVGKKNNIPVIMNITGMGQMLNTGRFKSVFRKLYKTGCTNANTVFFQNEFNRRFFVENNMVDESKTKLLPGSGVNVDRFKPREKEKSDSIKFLFIGRLMKDKGIDEYIEVASRISKKYDNVEFQVLGSYEEEQYKDIIKNKDHINYLGSSRDVRNEIAKVDCIVHPSYHEGMSNVLLEGGAMGKPLIASNIPGCKEIIDNGKNGYLFEVKNVKDLESKIEFFIELNQEDRIKMGKISREKIVDEFDRNIVVSAYINEIEKLLEEGV